jgi:hypothetical protein
MIDYKKEAVEYCLNEFDFERAHAVMKQVDWKWHTRYGFKVPTLFQLMLAAQQRLNDAWETKTTIESEGLRAIYIPGEVDNNGKVRPPALELMFIEARRPKPPSLKEQALAILDDASTRLDAAHENILRRALEQLP